MLDDNGNLQQAAAAGVGVTVRVPEQIPGRHACVPYLRRVVGERGMEAVPPAGIASSQPWGSGRARRCGPHRGT